MVIQKMLSGCVEKSKNELIYAEKGFVVSHDVDMTFGTTSHEANFTFLQSKRRSVKASNGRVFKYILYAYSMFKFHSAVVPLLVLSQGSPYSARFINEE